MLHSIPSNRLENLAIVLDTLLRDAVTTTRAALAPQQVVVPHPGLAMWLRQALAAVPERRIAMNLEFLLPREWLWALLRGTLDSQSIPEHPPFAPEILGWRLFSHLGSPEVIADARFAEATDAWRCAPLRLQGLRRFQLAQELAARFDEMLLYRPDWLLAFERGAEAVPEPDRAGPVPDPDWQALLWQRLIRETPDHPLALLQAWRAALDRGTLKASPAGALPQSVVFFGTHTLPPLWLNVLSALAREGVVVHVLHLNPCDDYWDDAESPRDRLRRRMRVRARQRAPYRPGEEPLAAPFNWDASAAHASGAASPSLATPHPLSGASEDAEPPSALRLLTTLGAQGQQFIRVLHELAHDETPVFSDPLTDEGPSTEASTLVANPVRALQADLLRAPDASRAQPKRAAPDERLVIVRAPNRLREVEGLHDWLLARFAEDDTLRPRDVAVLCPDVAAYAPMLRAVFATPGSPTAATHHAAGSRTGASPEALFEAAARLPCTIADRAAPEENADLAVLHELLRADDARFSRQSVIDWLRSPALAARFGLAPDDREALARVLHDAGGFWGLHPAQRGEWLHGEPDKPFGLDAYGLEDAIRRGLLAFAHGDDAGPGDDPATASTPHPTLALPDAVDDEDAARLARFARLLATVDRWRRALAEPRPLHEWAERIHHGLRRAFFAEGGDFERLHETVRLALERLRQEADGAGFTEAVEWPLVRHAFEAALERAVSRAGRGFIRGAVTVASLMPMRSVPFRLIAILGLDADAFPRDHARSGLDRIAQSRPRALDRSRRTDDRQLFLESLLSARDGLWLSYVAYDPKDRTERAPSLVLSLLLDHLEAVSTFDRKCDVRELPLHAYDPRAFQTSASADGRPTIASFAGEWLRLARLSHAPPADAAVRHQPLASTADAHRGSSTQASSEGQTVQATIENIKTELDLDDLARGHADPVADWAHHVLGLRRFDEERPAEDEAFDVSGLERYTLLDEVIRAHLAQAFGVSPPSAYTVPERDAHLRAALERRRQLGRWPLTQSLDAECAEWQPVIDAWLRVLLDDLQGPPETCAVRHRIGDVWLVGVLERFALPPFQAGDPGADPSPDAAGIADRSGDDDPSRNRNGASSLMRLWRPGKPKAAFVLSAWLKHLVANLHRPTWTELIGVPKDRPCCAYRLNPTRAENAREALEPLIGDLLAWRGRGRPAFHDAELVLAWVQLEHDRRSADQAGALDADAAFAEAFAQTLRKRWNPESDAQARRDGSQADAWADDPLRTGLWPEGPPADEPLEAAIRARFSPLVDVLRVLK